MLNRRLLAVALAISLIAVSTSANPKLLGIVTPASDANLGTGPVSEGANVYDGDRLATDEDGALTFRARSTILYLARRSRLTVTSLHSNAAGTQANLTAGTLVFTATNASTFQVSADTATIRAAADTKTIRPDHGNRPQNPLRLRPSGRPDIFLRRRIRTNPGRKILQSNPRPTRRQHFEAG
jgi:hypothetical protein